MSLQVGAPMLVNDHWQVSLRVPTHVLALGAGIERVVLTTDAWGAVKVESTFAENDADARALQARAEAAFASLGLPPPTYQGLKGADATCGA